MRCRDCLSIEEVPDEEVTAPPWGRIIHACPDPEPVSLHDFLANPSPFGPAWRSAPMEPLIRVYLTPMQLQSVRLSEPDLLQVNGIDPSRPVRSWDDPATGAVAIEGAALPGYRPRRSTDPPGVQASLAADGACRCSVCLPELGRDDSVSVDAHRGAQIGDDEIAAWNEILDNARTTRPRTQEDPCDSSASS